MPGGWAFAAGLLLPVMFWVCRWQGWEFWWCGLVLLPLAWPRRSGGGIYAAGVMPHVMRWLPGVLAAVVGSVALAFRSNISLQYYSVLSSLFFLAVFAGSLLQEQSLIERLARRAYPDLPEFGVRYTRKVTQAWCVFFIANTVVTLVCIKTSDVAWAIYNGFIAYILMGCMFVGEWLVRRKVMRDAHHV